MTWKEPGPVYIGIFQKFGKFPREETLNINQRKPHPSKCGSFQIKLIPVINELKRAQVSLNESK